MRKCGQIKKHMNGSFILRSWKKMALDTLAASTSVGIAIGSAAVMAVGAATSFSQGIQQGVQNFSVDRSPVLPGLLNVDSSRPDSLANSIVDTRRRVEYISLGLMPEELLLPLMEYWLAASIPLGDAEDRPPDLPSYPLSFSLKPS